MWLIKGLHVIHKSIHMWLIKGLTFDSFTLDSGMDVAPLINVAPGTFGKNIKRSP
jgi:hypothetical protein